MKSANINSLSAVAFQDYVRLRRAIEADGEKATEALGQHDKDQVEYNDAYEVFQEYSQELLEYVDRTTLYYANLISSMLGLLSQKKLLTDEEVQEISKVANTLYEQDLKDRNKE